MAWLGILLLVVLSGIFSGTEIAMTSLNQLRMRRAAQSGDAGAKRIVRVLDDFDMMLSTILAGNDLVNIAASSLAAMIALRIAGEGAVTASGVLVTVLILIFGEIYPKILAKRHNERFARVTAPALGALMRVLRPVLIGVVRASDAIAKIWHGKGRTRETITEDEFSEILNTVEDEGVLDEETSDLVQSAMEFDDLGANDAMTPRVDMVTVDLDDPPQEILRKVVDSEYSRIPVWRDTIDNIVGILPVKSYLLDMAEDGKCDIEKILMPALFVHQTMTLDDVLKTMREKHMHIAIVLDEFGGTQGMLTMEDVLEQLVGEIWDESDEITEECRKVSDSEYICSGMMTLHEFFDAADLDERDVDSEYTTMGGWAVEMLDAQPKEGKSFSFDRLEVTVLKMDGMRVDSLRVRIRESGEEEEVL